MRIVNELSRGGQMAMPAVVKRTYDMFKDESSFRKLLKQMGRKLLKIRDPRKKARYVHNKIDTELEKQFNDPMVANLVQCQRGCTGCCHTQVSVTEGEALLLADRIKKDGLNIDFEKLYLQAQTESSVAKFYRLDYGNRACIFLNGDGECSVYEDRPSVCRTNHVLSDPEKCVIKTVEEGVNPSVQLLNTFSSDSWVYALFKESRITGTLPSVLRRVLTEFNLYDKHDIP